MIIKMWLWRVLNMPYVLPPCEMALMESYNGDGRALYLNKNLYVPTDEEFKVLSECKRFSGVFIDGKIKGVKDE